MSSRSIHSGRHASFSPSNILRAVGRGTLTVLRIPAVPQVLVFGLLWRRFYFRIVDHLQIGPWANPKGFPPIWTAWVALLFTLPTFSAIQLAWLLGTCLLRKRLAGKRSVGTRRDREHGMLLTGGRGGDEDDWNDKDPRARAQRLKQGLHNPWTWLWGAQCVLYFYILLSGLYHYTHYEHPGDIRIRPALQRALANAHPKGTGYARGEKIFIAAAFHDNELVLPYWTKTMLDVVTYLGTDNVYVSIVENYSSDRSPELLRAFAQQLDKRGVRNRVLVNDETVPRPEKIEWNPRIEFLAAIRNQALEPLLLSPAGSFDKVLFSNDIFIEPESVIELLETREGDYDFACGLDFGHYGAYDAWVIRDRIGRLTSMIWPYFFDAASADAMRKEEPVPVLTCWNGIVAFRPDPILPIHLRANNTLSTAPLVHPPPPGHPWARKLGSSPALTEPLRMRASVDGECFSSESFLLPYDFRRVMGLEKIFANPRVVSGYIWKYYTWHKWVLRSPWVKWFVEEVYAGAWMQDRRMIIGDEKTIWTWDGVECQPWW